MYILISLDCSSTFFLPSDVRIIGLYNDLELAKKQVSNADWKGNWGEYSFKDENRILYEIYKVELNQSIEK